MELSIPRLELQAAVIGNHLVFRRKAIFLITCRRRHSTPVVDIICTRMRTSSREHEVKKEKECRPCLYVSGETVELNRRCVEILSFLWTLVIRNTSELLFLKSPD